MPDVSSIAPAEVDQWIVFDVHKNSLVAGVLPAAGGSPEVTRLENTERAVRRFLGRFGDPGALAVAYEAGPCGYELFRLLSGMGVACDVIAPSLVPVRAGDRVKTDRRDAKRLVRLYRAGELFFVEVPSPAHEGLRDLVRARDDLRGARTAARHRVVKALLRHGHVYREGRHAWTRRHAAWLSRQHLADPLAHRALCHTRSHLAAIDAQIAAIDSELEAVASSEPWCDPVRSDYKNHRLVVFDAANLGGTRTFHVLANLAGSIPVANTNAALGASASFLFAEPEGIDFDAAGNLWVANNNDGGGAGGVQNTRTSLVRITPALQLAVLATPPSGSVTPTVAQSNGDFSIYQVPKLGNDLGVECPRFRGHC